MREVIQQILEFSGPMPDVAAHERYLRTLKAEELHERLSALRVPARKVDVRPLPSRDKFWRRAAELTKRQEVMA